MVFGVFDGLHEGHRWFLRTAVEHGDKLIVVAARDEIVRMLKKKNPLRNQAERLRALGAMPEVNRAVLGDAKMGSYKVLKKHQPDVICVGYDQHGLAEDLKKKIELPVVRLESYMPDKFHTSWLT